jgi:hypothetical protein
MPNTQHNAAILPFSFTPKQRNAFQVWRNITGLLCHGGLSKIESCSWHVACLSYAIRRAVDNTSLTHFPAIHDYTVAQACKGIVQLQKGIQGGKAHLPAS